MAILLFASLQYIPENVCYNKNPICINQMQNQLNVQCINHKCLPVYAQKLRNLQHKTAAFL